MITCNEHPCDKELAWFDVDHSMPAWAIYAQPSVRSEVSLEPFDTNQNACLYVRNKKEAAIMASIANHL